MQPEKTKKEIIEPKETESKETTDKQNPLPAGLEGDKIKTFVTDMATVVKNKLSQLNDLATLEVLLDVSVRCKHRLESIRKMSSASSIKVRGHWKTTNPQMHISKLEAKKITNDEMQISFGVFEVDEKGNKKLFTHYSDVQLRDGSTIKRPTSAEYRVAYEVVETIRNGKPITRELITL